MDLNSLALLLASANESFQSIEAKFKKSFDPTSYPSVCAIITDLAADGFTGAIGSQVEALVSVYLCHVMASANPDANGALCMCLQQLDKHIREDSRRLEQLKYRQTAKDFKKYARDAVDVDGFRCRTAIKCFIFQCILGQVDTNQTPNKILKQAQAILDGMLESWSTTPGPLNDKLKDLGNAERSTLISNGIVSSATVPSSTATFCRVGPLDTPLFAGEMHYLLGPETHWVTFDSKGHPKEWSSFKRLLISATKQVLGTKERQELLQNSSYAHQVNLTPAIVASIASHDPEVAAALVAKSSKPAQHIHQLLAQAEAGNLALSHLNTVVLHSVNHLDSTLVSKYIQLSCEKAMAANDTAVVKGFATALHQLVSKNKDITIPESRKDDLKALFAKNSNVQEVQSWWSDFK
eukprot:GILI01022452.1.p1 GENE.GILI01022452.1~~GILI01022452.1.p1  ORF type:complete len:408 (-),score=50.90 GILI01022452.1:82-1305(-)